MKELEIYTENNREYVDFEGTKYVVSTTSETEQFPNEKYIRVRNIHKPDKDIFYTRRIKDCYDDILSGRADCLMMSRRFFSLTPIETPIKFLNRELGERCREKFLREFDVSKGFYWYIGYKYESGFSEGVTLLYDDGYDAGYLRGLNGIKRFDSEESAKEFIEKEESRIDKYVKEYSDEEKFDEFLDCSDITDSDKHLVTSILSKADSSDGPEFNWKKYFSFQVYQGLSL